LKLSRRRCCIDTLVIRKWVTEQINHLVFLFLMICNSLHLISVVYQVNSTFYLFERIYTMLHFDEVQLILNLHIWIDWQLPFSRWNRNNRLVFIKIVNTTWFIIKNSPINCIEKSMFFNSSDIRSAGALEYMNKSTLLLSN